jgi:hypothetical protein
MFAEHCCCETPKLETGKSGSKMIEWKEPGAGAENDYWDCLVASCVLASLEGVKVHVEKKAPTKKRNSRKRQRVSQLAC